MVLTLYRMLCQALNMIKIVSETEAFCYDRVMSSIPCNIVILPQSNIANKVTLLSKQLESYSTYFTLKEGEYYPHTSLYMVQLDIKSLDGVNDILLKIAQNTSKIKLNADSYHQEGGYIDVSYARHSDIDKLQMTIVDAINPIRDGLRDKDKVRLETAIGKERENIEHFGYRGVGELFTPHLTLTRFRDSLSIATDNLPIIGEFDSTFLKLALFEMGDNGTCVRKIAEFILGGE